MRLKRKKESWKKNEVIKRGNIFWIQCKKQKEHGEK